MSAVRKLDAAEAANIILGLDSFAVVMHQRPDGDTVGTATALVKALHQMGKKAALVCADNIPKRLEFITDGLTRVENFKGMTPITVDIASPAQAGDIFPSLGEVALMIDHHEVGEPFAPNYIVKGASSAAEVLFDVLDELIKAGKLTLTKEIAAPLYAALSSDTGSFKYSLTTPSTLRLAARLLECGIDHSRIAHLLYSQKSREQIRAEGFIAGRIKTESDGRIAYATHTRRDREELCCPEESFETAIDIVRELSGVEIAIVVRETDKGTLKASIRSIGADVASIAAKFGGGGHIRAAGCSPEADSPEDAAIMLIEEAKKLLLKEG